MTKDDAPDYARNSANPALIDQEQATKGAGVPRTKLQYTDLAWQVHARLTDTYTLLDFLRTEADRIRKLVRPPFARFEQLSATPADKPDPKYRDPRIARSYEYDMQMPPYMRDSDVAPLSLSWRQYETLMRLLDMLSPSDSKPADPPMQSRINRRVDEENGKGIRGEPR